MNDVLLKTDEEYRYRLLDRLKSDCDYFLGAGARDEKNLWGGTVKEHLDDMRQLLSSFPEGNKPEWISLEAIREYEQRMMGYTMLDIAEKKESNKSTLYYDIIDDKLVPSASKTDVYVAYAPGPDCYTGQILDFSLPTEVTDALLKQMFQSAANEATLHKWRCEVKPGELQAIQNSFEACEDSEYSDTYEIMSHTDEEVRLELCFWGLHRSSSLGEDWVWQCYCDGSGSLVNTNSKEKFFSYDLTTKEYRDTLRKNDWTPMYDDSFADFCAYCEQRMSTYLEVSDPSEGSRDAQLNNRRMHGR